MQETSGLKAEFFCFSDQICSVSFHQISILGIHTLLQHCNPFLGSNLISRSRRWAAQPEEYTLIVLFCPLLVTHTHCSDNKGQTKRIYFYIFDQILYFITIRQYILVFCMVVDIDMMINCISVCFMHIYNSWNDKWIDRKSISSLLDNGIVCLVISFLYVYGSKLNIFRTVRQKKTFEDFTINCGKLNRNFSLFFWHFINKTIYQ